MDKKKTPNKLSNRKSSNRKLFDQVLTWFESSMPVAESELQYSNPFELLVAVMLSAQCTDKRVNMVTPALFAAYPTAEAMARATSDEVFEFVQSVSYPRSKAEHLVQMAQRLVTVYGGQVPDNIDDLQTLQGVGRKTANVVCAVIWNQPTMAVDTHIFRVSERLGLTTNSKNPLQTEKELVKYIPADIIPKAHHWLLLHGRYVCQARRPKCEQCGLQSYCRFFNQK
ncbi:MAG: endonuclease III [Paludibacteraceae bacterium]|nr:endonuclease III [Paludibacteraceae bacterium]MBQ2607681.1 endonuclease III [Paludibacteraceae bacterium]